LDFVVKAKDVFDLARRNSLSRHGWLPKKGQECRICDKNAGALASDSDIVITHPELGEKTATFRRNDRSRSLEMSGHDRSEYGMFARTPSQAV